MMPLSVKYPIKIAWSAAVLAIAPIVSAVQPGVWIQSTEADFQAGETEGTVVTNLGDIKLAISRQVLGELPEQTTVIYDLQPLAQAMYIAAGPEAKLYEKSGGDLEQILKLENEQIFALDLFDEKLLIAVSGTNSRLVLLENGLFNTVVEVPGVRYIWDLAVRGNKIYLATGDEGKLLRVDLDKTGQAPVELLDAKQANLLCIGLDAQERIYTGTDMGGLVYRIEINKDHEPAPFVIFDADEPEIGALLISADGSVYVGTADAKQARPGRLEDPSDQETGRPDTNTENEESPKPPASDAPNLSPDTEPSQPSNEVEAISKQTTGLESDEQADPQTAPDTQENVQSDEKAAGPQEQAAANSLVRRLQSHTETETNKTTDTRVEDSKHHDNPQFQPTAEQFDRLRQLIRERLDEAKEKGSLQVSTQVAGLNRRSKSSESSRARAAKRAAASQKGNGLYRIDSDGFVHEIFRESVMILRILEQNGTLLVATGNDGQVLTVDPETEETTSLVDIDSEQVPAMIQSPAGGILLGTANPAKIVQLDNQLTDTGQFTSPVQDASQVTQWGSLSLTGDVPADTSVSVETRSGNVKDPEKAAWANWSAAERFEPVPHLTSIHPRPIKIQSPPARFFQYRLTLDGLDQVTPTVRRVEVTYVTPNLRPKISSLKATYAKTSRQDDDDAIPPTIINIEWEATDPNEDPLIYELEYQPAGSSKYLSMAKAVKYTSYEWQTRRVPDGLYVIRLSAHDRRHNPPDMALTNSRRSNPVLVDNTAPALNDLQTTICDTSVTISGLAQDQYSQIHMLAHAVDSADEFEPLLPLDLIFDSTQERWQVKIDDLEVGPHVVTIRAQDARGNTVYRPVLFEIY